MYAGRFHPITQIIKFSNLTNQVSVPTPRRCVGRTLDSVSAHHPTWHPTAVWETLVVQCTSSAANALTNGEQEQRQPGTHRTSRLQAVSDIKVTQAQPCHCSKPASGGWQALAPTRSLHTTRSWLPTLTMTPVATVRCDLCPGPPITIHTLIIAWRFCVRVDCSPGFCVCLRERAEKIVTGSFNGVLRVYYPRQRDYKIDDLMLEQSLDQPIIGLLAGRFTAYVRLPFTTSSPVPAKTSPLIPIFCCLCACVHQWPHCTCCAAPAQAGGIPSERRG